MVSDYPFCESFDIVVTLGFLPGTSPPVSFVASERFSIGANVPVVFCFKWRWLTETGESGLLLCYFYIDMTPRVPGF